MLVVECHAGLPGKREARDRQRLGILHRPGGGRDTTLRDWKHRYVAAIVYVDESKDRGFRLAGVLVQASDAGRARLRMRRHVPAGAHRVNFVKESPARQRAILATIATLGVGLVVIEAPGGCRASEQRAWAIRAHPADERPREEPRTPPRAAHPEAVP
jgi:hypothetical protein